MRIREILTEEPLPKLRFKSSHHEGYSTVWIDIAKFDPWFQRDKGFYVGPGGSDNAIKGRYERFQEWLKRGEPIGMPEASINTYYGDRVGFGNGRHRYAVLRDMGVQRIPMMVPDEQVADFKRLFR